MASKIVPDEELYDIVYSDLEKGFSTRKIMKMYKDTLRKFNLCWTSGSVRRVIMKIKKIVGYKTILPFDIDNKYVKLNQQLIITEGDIKSKVEHIIFIVTCVRIINREYDKSISECDKSISECDKFIRDIVCIYNEKNYTSITKDDIENNPILTDFIKKQVIIYEEVRVEREIIRVRNRTESLKWQLKCREQQECYACGELTKFDHLIKPNYYNNYYCNSRYYNKYGICSKCFNEISIREGDELLLRVGLRKAFLSKNFKVIEEHIYYWKMQLQNKKIQREWVCSIGVPIIMKQIILYYNANKYYDVNKYYDEKQSYCLYLIMFLCIEIKKREDVDWSIERLMSFTSKILYKSINYDIHFKSIIIKNRLEKNVDPLSIFRNRFLKSIMHKVLVINLAIYRFLDIKGLSSEDFPIDIVNLICEYVCIDNNLLHLA